jgi:hypothetical protein
MRLNSRMSHLTSVCKRWKGELTCHSTNVCMYIMSLCIHIYFISHSFYFKVYHATKSRFNIVIPVMEQQWIISRVLPHHPKLSSSSTFVRGHRCHKWPHHQWLHERACHLLSPRTDISWRTPARINNDEVIKRWEPPPLATSWWCHHRWTRPCIRPPRAHFQAWTMR